MAKKNQQQKSREVQKKIQATNPRKQRTAEDMERLGETISNGLGLFGAIIGGIGNFTNALRKANMMIADDELRRTIKCAAIKDPAPDTVDGEAVIVSSQIKK